MAKVTASLVAEIDTSNNITALYAYGPGKTTPSSILSDANSLTKSNVAVATTANITLSGAQTIDGVSITTEDVLVKSQTNTAQNGIYTAGTPWVRRSDADTWAELPDALVFVEQGTVNGNTLWSCTSNAGGTLGTTAVTWAAAASGSSSIGIPLTGSNAITGTLGFTTAAYLLRGNIGGSIGSQAPVFHVGGIGNYPGVNAGAPAGQTDNTVGSIGWNMLAGNGRYDTTKPASGIVFENNYRQGGVQAFETHITMTDTSGTERRAFTAFMPRDGGAGSSIAMQTDALSFQKYDGTARLNISWATGAMQLYGSAQWQYEVNNYAFAKQLNAAAGGYINIPYYDSTDRYVMAGAFQSRGAVIQTGTYAGQWAHLEATSTPVANDILLHGSFGVANAAADLKAFHFQAASANLAGAIFNTSGSAYLDVTTSGASADAYARFSGNGATSYAVGLDRSDNKFKVSYGTAGNATLGANDRLTIDTTGNVTIAGQLTAAAKTPSSASDTGVAGTICADASFIYVCTATNTWKRVAIATW